MDLPIKDSPYYEPTKKKLQKNIQNLLKAKLDEIDCYNASEGIMGIDIYANFATPRCFAYVVYGFELPTHSARPFAIRFHMEPRPGYEGYHMAKTRLMVTEIAAHRLNAADRPIHNDPIVVASVGNLIPSKPLEIPEDFFEALYRYEVLGPIN